MTREELHRMFAPWRQQHTRRAWKPVAATQRSFTAMTWFGGSPIGKGAVPWPICTGCQAPMRLLLQLDLDALPVQGWTSGPPLLQFFYCSTDDGGCETWRPYSGTHCFRFMERGREVEKSPVPPLPKVTISDWEPFDDTPSTAEHELLGVEYDYDFDQNTVSVRCANPPLAVSDLSIDLEVAETISTAAMGDKLFGFPHWVQGIEYPNCRRCGQQMSLLVQLDSADNLDYTFGDLGCGHITRCPVHLDELAFGWACG